MKTLQEIARSTNTDKEHLHDYMRTYSEVFSAMRHAPVRMLEMGVLVGDSLQCWLEYFDNPAAKIDGLDIELHRCREFIDSRLKLSQGSQADVRQLFQGRQFDIIIDDAGHFARDQIRCFSECINDQILSPGGIYVIEDLHTHASAQHCDAHFTIMQFLCAVSTEIQGRGPEASGRVTRDGQWVNVDTITFRRGMAVIRKAK